MLGPGGLFQTRCFTPKKVIDVMAAKLGTQERVFSWRFVYAGICCICEETYLPLYISYIIIFVYDIQASSSCRYAFQERLNRSFFVCVKDWNEKIHNNVIFSLSNGGFDLQETAQSGELAENEEDVDEVWRFLARDSHEHHQPPSKADQKLKPWKDIIVVHVHHFISFVFFPEMKVFPWCHLAIFRKLMGVASCTYGPCRSPSRTPIRKRNAADWSTSG